MSPEEFATLAQKIAGPHWRTKLGPMIGRNRWSVMDYADGTTEVPEIVAKLMVLLAGRAEP